MAKNLDNIKIYRDYYYILEFTRLTDIRLLHYYFITRAAAQRCLDNALWSKQNYFRIVRGSKVGNYIKLQDNWRTNIGKSTKYSYPSDRLTPQDRKTFRTVMRRRLRRMGLLTTVQSKKHYSEPPGIVKYVKNTQKVAINKNSAARVFRLERKPDRYYYILLNREEPRKRGYLFWVYVIRFDLKTGKMKKQEFHLRKNDLIVPYLIWDIEKAIYEKVKSSDRTMAYYRGFGFKFYEEKIQPKGGV